MSGRWAVISIGTNSTRVLLADMARDLPRVELSRSQGTRIGEGLQQDGVLGDEPMRRTLAAVREHLRTVRGRYVRMYAIATSAVRRARNGDEFAARVREIVGVPLDILSGDREASASYRGAITALEPLGNGDVGVIDTGGGSTEYAIGNGAVPEQTTSCEIGAVRLTEAFPALTGRGAPIDAATLESARRCALAALEPLSSFRRVARLALVGGSATTAASVIAGRARKPSQMQMTRIDLQRVLARLCDLRFEQRLALVGMKAQRADILPAGIIVVDAALALLGHDGAVATTADLLLGYLLEQRGRTRADESGRLRPWKTKTSNGTSNRW